MPLLKIVFGKVCSERAENPFARAALLFLTECCTDDVVLATVQDWVNTVEPHNQVKSVNPTIKEPVENPTPRPYMETCFDESDATAQVKKEEANGEVTFFFVDADYIRNTTLTTLPTWQVLTKQPNVLIKRTLSIGKAYRRQYVSEISSVSHRWETPEEPDTNGVQLRTIKEHLLSKGSQAKLVWFDYWCMPQGSRTPAEKVLFKWMLSNVNLLYLGTSVLLLVDISYLSRFWTQFEAWLSMQTTSSEGLLAAPESSRRCTMKCIHNASEGSEDVKLVDMWAKATPQQAQQILSMPDVVVTNQGDKDMQLAKTSMLGDDVRKAFNAAQYQQLTSIGFTESGLMLMGFSAEVARQAGCSANQLKDNGHSAQQLKDAGYSGLQLKDAGYTAKELKDVGYTAKQLTDAGYTGEQLKDSGYTAAELHDAGHSDLSLKAAGYTAKELTDAGYTAAQLKSATYTAKQLKDAFYGAKQLKDAGYTAEQLKDAGYTCKHLKDAGYTARQLSAVGYSQDQLAAADFSLGELMSMPSEVAPPAASGTRPPRRRKKDESPDNDL